MRTGDREKKDRLIAASGYPIEIPLKSRVGVAQQKIGVVGLDQFVRREGHKVIPAKAGIQSPWAPASGAWGG